MSSPFHRLLTFFATRSSPNPQTITFLDSLRGDLSLGLNFPVALFLAATRHVVFRNTGAFSLAIHVPTVKTSRQLLGGPGRFDIDEAKKYGLRDLLAVTSGAGLATKLDAMGCWGLIADQTGVVSGRDVRAYQRGEVMESVARRRQNRSDVLPFWRGGPIWYVSLSMVPQKSLREQTRLTKHRVGGHSWMVSKLFDVDVYSSNHKHD
ncbi:hypothetical protein ANO11243_038690 [Dothideomycetidae sp. 11243]|nr:hypothetical protein ANO11243_038690 [fungal sp. No.11243]